MWAQNLTVGTVQSHWAMSEGYNLFAPNGGNKTYLIDNCGRVINRWQNSTYKPGSSVYLLEDGSLLRTCRIPNAGFLLGGLGGRIEKWDWNDNLIWSYEFSGTDFTQHHDIEPLANGNILILATEKKKGLEAIAAGRSPSLLANNEVWSEFVIEIEPIGADSGAVVWEWHVWDHLVQDYDSTLSNYGVVADHPELMDLNYVGTSAYADWLHANSVAYHPGLDQITLSFANTNEIWIIDHSTTAAEAASHAGGNRGKGGDILYRWGNPQVYRRGTPYDQSISFQHNVHWIPDGYPNAGKLLIFNNGIGRNYSSAEIVTPPQTAPGDYAPPGSQAFGPAVADRSVVTALQTDFFTRIMGGAQQLPNGNMLMTNAAGGYAIELDSMGQLLWRYVNPMTGLSSTFQGSSPSPSSNSIFRLERYGPDFPGFVGKDMSPGDPLEIGFDISACLPDLVSSPKASSAVPFRIFPNPTQNEVFFEYDGPRLPSFHMRDLHGNTVISGRQLPRRLDLSPFPNGVYFLELQGGPIQKIIKISL